MAKMKIFAYLFIFTFAAAAEASPWVWDCDADLQTCSRVLPSQTSAPLDFMECKMTCSDVGTLLPLPSSFALSKTLVPVFDEASFQIGNFDMTQDVRDLAEQYFDDVFLGYLFSMRTGANAKKSKQRQGDEVLVLIDLAVEEPFSHFTLETDEGYGLEIEEPSGGLLVVTIQAQTWYGLHHGFETLSQLISWNSVTSRFQVYEQATIQDSPAYPHRGISVDTSRNFMPVEVLQELIDGLGQVKLNTFHWHITDAQSFPLSLPNEPRLAEYGAYYDGLVYTDADARALVDYATVRGVRIVPELDTPAHCANGWQFGDAEAGLGKLVLCDNLEEDRCRGGICGVLNPVNDNLYDVLETVFGDFVDIFPGDTFHLGGDEVTFNCWYSSPEIADYFEQNGVDDVDDEDMYQLWRMFLDRTVEKFDSASGGTKRVTVWDSSITNRSDAAEFLPPDQYTIEVWAETTDLQITNLINAGYDVVLSNSDALYLDCGVGNWADEGPFYCDPYKQWRDLYGYDPRKVYLDQPGSDPSRTGQILGAEMGIWSEMNSAEALNVRVWPRAAALAERLWTDPQPGDWRDAEIRFVHARERLSQRGVSCDGVQMYWCHQNEGRCRCTEDTC